MGMQSDRSDDVGPPSPVHLGTQDAWARGVAARIDGGGSCEKAEEALVELFREAVRHEVIAEEQRARLCEIDGFSISDAFSGLVDAVAKHSGCRALPGRVPMEALRTWVSAGSCTDTAPATCQELTRAALRRDAPALCELEMTYPDFCALILPRDERYKDIRRRVLALSHGSDGKAAELSPSLTRELRRLLKELSESIRVLQPLTHAVEDRLIRPVDAFQLLAGPGCTRVVTTESVRELLSEQFGAFTPEESRVLFRRLDSQREGVVDLHEVEATVKPLPIASIVANLSAQEQIERNLGLDNNENVANALRMAMVALSRLGDTDVIVESSRDRLANALTTSGAKQGAISLESLQRVYTYLDRGAKGFVSATDIWQLLERAQRSTELESAKFLVKDLACFYDPFEIVTTRVTFRHICLLVLPWLSGTGRDAREAASDEDARSALFLLSQTTRCPGCGVPAQRSAVTLQVVTATCCSCGAPFTCEPKAVDSAQDEYWCQSSSEALLDATVQEKLLELLEMAAGAAAQAVQLQRDLAKASVFVSDPRTTLATALGIHGNMEAATFERKDLQSLLLAHGLWHQDSEKALQLLWLRLTSGQPAGVARTIRLEDLARLLLNSS